MSKINISFQSGVFKEVIATRNEKISLKELRDLAAKFMQKIYSNYGFGDVLPDHLLLYYHDINSTNILQLITTSNDIVDGAQIEVIIDSHSFHQRLLLYQHVLCVHSYKSPTFCDFCGEMLFGLVKQGLKCRGCKLNYHKRCASKIPNNCKGYKQQLLPSSISAFRNSTTKRFMKTSLQKRSGSWSGRSSSMKLSKTTWIKIPHAFQVHSYKRPTVCHYCKKLLKGLIRQGLQCRDCKYNCHRKCLKMVEDNCQSSDTIIQNMQFGLHDKESLKVNYGGSMKDLWSSSIPDVPENDNDDKGLTETIQNFNNSTVMINSYNGKTQTTPNVSLRTNDIKNDEQDVSYNDNILTDSQNIPLMRIVMSMKQTKPCKAKILQEGWMMMMMHYADPQCAHKKHYWRLDTKAISLYDDDSSMQIYKKILLSEILEVKFTPSHNSKNAAHFLEIKTRNSTYYMS